MKAYLSLGSNLGNRQKNIETAIKELISNGCWLMAKSHLYETEPWKMKPTNDFLNGVVLIETELEPEKLLQTILEVERAMGRIRTASGFEPRTIDIDILFYEDKIINTQTITVPHPLLQERRFILVPLNEITPDFVHPVLKKTVRTLLEECRDGLGVREFSS